MKKDIDYLIVIGLIVVSFLVLGIFYFTSQNDYIPTNDTKQGNLILNNETMICNFSYLCFLRKDGKWHKPVYSTGTNLILANELETKNEQMIKNFFKQKKINIVVNTTEAVVEAMSFGYYLGYYFGTIKNDFKDVNSSTYSDFNFQEPAFIILGPDLNMKDSIKIQEGDIIITSSSRESLAKLLGKVLLIIVS